jgi:hypothetical protein
MAELSLASCNESVSKRMAWLGMLVMMPFNSAKALCAKASFFKTALVSRSCDMGRNGTNFGLCSLNVTQK